MLKKTTMYALVLMLLVSNILWIPNNTRAANSLLYIEWGGIGYLSNTFTVKEGDVSYTRYRTIGWIVKFVVDGVPYKTIVKAINGETLKELESRNGNTTVQIMIPFSHPNTNPIATDSKPVNLSWNRSILDNLYLEYKDSGSRNAIIKYISKGGTVYVDSIMSIVPPNSNNPKSIVKDGAEYRDSDANKYTNPGYTYVTASGIKSAASWAHPSDLDNYFNMKIDFEAQQLPPITGKYIARYYELDDNGKILQKLINPDKVETRTFPAGEGVEVTHYSDSSLSNFQYMGFNLEDAYNTTSYGIGDTVNFSTLDSRTSRTVTLNQGNPYIIINFFYKQAGVKPYVIGEVTNDPTSVEFNNEDIYVDVTVKGTVYNLDPSKIKSWMLKAKMIEDTTFQTGKVEQSITSAEKTFTFRVSKTVMTNVDEYIQKFVGQATVYDIYGNAYTHPAISVETTIYKGTPATTEPPEDYDPSLQPPTADIDIPESSSKSKPTLYFEQPIDIRWEYGNYEGFDAVDYIMEIEDTETGKEIYKVMVEHDDPDDNYLFKPLQLVSGSKIQRDKFISSLYETELEGFEPGKVYSVTIRAYDGHNWSSKSDEHYFMVTSPPEAKFIWDPLEPLDGDDITITNQSTHPFNKPMTAKWEIMDPRFQKSYADTWDTEILDSKFGYYIVKLEVKDELGAGDVTVETIPVLDPRPKAVLNITGTLKENRAFQIDGSLSTSPIPLDLSKTKITITPLTSGIATTEIKPVDVINGQLTVDALIKKEGTYKVELYVENERGFFRTAEQTIYIQPDLEPNVDFEIPTVVYLNKADSYRATVLTNDNSYTIDQDILAEKVWTISYNSDNDKASGLPYFDDESSIQIAESELLAGPKTYILNGVTIDAEFVGEDVQLKVSRIGYYKVELLGIEEFGQPTIDEYVTPLDRRRSDTIIKPLEAKVFVVDNKAPVVDFVVE